MPSRKDRQKNSTKISGTNVSPAPTPEMMPSQTSETIQSATPASVRKSSMNPTNCVLIASSRKSAIGWPIQVNVIWKTA